MIDESTLSAAEAAAILGVTRATLYAYVSRGLVRSEAGEGSRARRYRAEDLLHLRRRREQRRNPARAVDEALHFGAPLLDSSLTLIRDGRLFYRGLDAAELAVSARFEEVAALLWTGDRRAPFPDDLVDPEAPQLRELLRVANRLPPLEAFSLVLAGAAPHDPAAWDLAGSAVCRTGARILRLLAAVAAGVRPSRRPIAEVLARSFSTHLPEARQLVEAALVLWADHELNVSTFAARCVASALANPYAAVLGGLAALCGVRHGGATEQVEALFEEAGAPARARRVCEARLRRGERIPGFGHTLYPAGDPRCRLLLDLLHAARPRSRELALSDALAEAGLELIGRRPNVDFGVVALRRALGGPPGSALALIGVARSAGWIAHAIEQYADPRMIRPRARYVGVPPRDGDPG